MHGRVQLPHTESCPGDSPTMSGALKREKGSMIDGCGSNMFISSEG